MDDRELLGRYAQEQDQQAFAELVRRHSQWVHAAAKRQVRDGHAAEDVTQAVFLLLSRRARRVAGYGYLGGWLFRALSYCVKEVQRERVRRSRREEEAARMRREAASTEVGWEQIAPELEAAVGRLGRSDREAVLLRFYEQKPLAEVGRVLGVSEDTARKRVERAVGRLRERLAAKGVAVEAGSLGAIVLAHAGTDGPAGLVERAMAGIGSGTANGVARAIAKGAGTMMVLAKMKAAACVAVGLLVVGTGGLVAAWAMGQQNDGGREVTADPATMLPEARAGGPAVSQNAATRPAIATPDALGEQFVRLMAAGKTDEAQKLYLSREEFQFLFEGPNRDAAYDQLMTGVQRSLVTTAEQIRGAQFVRMNWQSAPEPLIVPRGKSFGPVLFRMDTKALDNTHVVARSANGQEMDIKLDEMALLDGQWKLVKPVRVTVSQGGGR